MIIFLLLIAMVVIVLIIAAAYTMNNVKSSVPKGLRIGVLYSRTPGFQSTYSLSHKEASALVNSNW